MRTRQRETIIHVRLASELVEGLDALKRRDGIVKSEAIRRGVALFLREKGITIKGERNR